MKKKVFLLALLAFPVIVMGQEPTEYTPEIKVTPPAFTGVQNTVEIFDNGNLPSIENYLASRIQFDKISRECIEQGTEVIQFTVTPDGDLTDFQVVNSVCPSIDEEMIRVLKTTKGMWKPGYNDGAPVSMEKEILMVFFRGFESIGKAPVEYFAEMAKKYFDKANNLFLKSNNPRKALKYYDRSIRYLPGQAALLLTRGVCRYELGDREGACSDWNRITHLGNSNFTVDEFQENLCGFKGYAEAKNILENK